VPRNPDTPTVAHWRIAARTVVTVAAGTATASRLVSRSVEDDRVFCLWIQVVLSLKYGMDSILKKLLVDRIYRINRIYVDHFPDENGQSLSPPAK